MASDVRISGFKWNRKGYAGVLNSAPVIALVKKEADRIAGACNADFERNPGETGRGYRVKRHKGKLATGYVVKTEGQHAHNSEREHNRLRNALGGS